MVTRDGSLASDPRTIGIRSLFSADFCASRGRSDHWCPVPGTWNGVDAAGISHARLVVELGSGTGGMTRAILAELPPESRLLAIELSPHFAELVGRIEDPRLVTYNGSAEDLAEILDRRGLGSPDVVVSGIPFSTMPRSTGLRIARAIHASLTASGCFVAYQLSRRVAEIMTPIMGSPDVSIVLRNIPPMRVYRWQANSQRFDS